MSEMVTGMGYIGTEPGVLYHMAPPYVTETVTGSEPVLQGAKSIKAVEIAGKSVQLSNKGKNLIDRAQVGRNSAKEVNPNNAKNLSSIESNYTGGGERGTYLENGKVKIIPVSINETLTIIMDTTKIAVALHVYVKNVDGLYDFIFDSAWRTTKYTYTATKDVYVVVYVRDNNTAQLYTQSLVESADIAIYKNDTSRNDIESYTGGIPCPSPGYPSDIQGVGVRTKNLIPDTKWAIFDNTYKYITLKLDPGKYVLSTNGVAPYGTIVKNADDLTLVVYYNNKFTISKSAQYIIYVNKGYAKSNTTGEDKAQLEVGDTITAYEPYGYKTELNIMGNNILDCKKGYGEGGNANLTDTGFRITSNGGTCYFTIVFDFKPGTYHISYKSERSGLTGGGFFISKKGSVAVNHINSPSGTYKITVGEGAGFDKISFCACWGGQNGDFAIFRDVQITKDESAEYEPYSGQSVEIYHREQLHGIGEYADKIIKKNDAWGIERNTVRWIPTSFIGYGERNGVKAWTAFYTKKFRGPVEKAFCNRLPHANNEQYIEHFYHVSNANMAWAYISTAHTIPKEDFEFVSVLMTPEWEPLPAETQEALNSLKPCGTTTFITTTDPLQPEITANYKRRK